MIRFNFDRAKFFAVVGILSRCTPDLDKLKAVKLLYFIDREHLRKHGKPILGDHYIGMNCGPVPSKAYDHLKEVEAALAVGSPLVADKEHRSKAGYPTFTTTGEPDTKILAQSELESIEIIIGQLGNKDAPELVNISHEHEAWKKAVRNTSIDYRLFFAEDPDECKDALEAMELGQEDRDFVDDI